MSPELQPTKRITTVFTPEAAEEVRRIADQEGLSVTGLIREAIAWRRYLGELREREAALFVHYPDGTKAELVLPPGRPDESPPASQDS